MGVNAYAKAQLESYLPDDSRGQAGYDQSPVAAFCPPAGLPVPVLKTLCKATMHMNLSDIADVAIASSCSRQSQTQHQQHSR